MMIRRIVAVLSLVAAACNPQDCQGAGFITDQPVVNVIDEGPPFEAKCVGNNVKFIGDVNVTNQLELDEIAGCEEIEGNLTILNSDDIVDLSAIAGLLRIKEGYFLALNNSALTSIDLGSVTEVDYGIGVIDNPAVATVNFQSIVESKGDITIRNNAVLSNVVFSSLEKMLADGRGGPGNLIVGANPAFAGFEGLELVTIIANSGNNPNALEIGIDVDAEGNIIAAGNDALQDLQGLNELETVNGDIFIGFNSALSSLAGLDDFTVHQKSIFIVGNDDLPNLSGLDGDGGADGEDDGLQTVNGSIFIGVFFDKFKQPVAAGNAVLTNLNGLNNLTTLGGSLVLGFNPQLENFDGLQVLTTINQDLVLVGSPAMDDFNGAEALTTINGNFFIGQLFDANDQPLTAVLDLNDTGVSTRVQVDLDVAGNNGFEALAAINKDLVVSFSDPGTLRIANTLAAVAGRLIVHSSDLDDLEGFETVGALGGLVVGLAVDKRGDLVAQIDGVSTGNDNFSAFTGLNVNALGAGGLAIASNPQLDDLATLPALANVAGDVTVADQDFQDLSTLDVVQIGGNLTLGALRNGNNAPVELPLADLQAITMNELTTIGGDVLIAFNDALDDVDFLLLNDVGGAFEVTDCENLAAIDGLVALGSVGDLRIHDLPELVTLNIPLLNDIDGDLFVSNNISMLNLLLPALLNVGDVADISDNAALANLNLTALNTVGGDFLFTDNEDIQDISTLNGLQSVGGTFIIARNPSIQELTLNALGTVGGSFELAQLNVDDFEGINSLSTVGEALRIRSNPNITSLLGLETVQIIGQKLSIVDNADLETVFVDANNDDVEDAGDSGLLALQQVGDPNFEDVGGERGVIEAQNNPVLDEETIFDLIDDFVANYEGSVFLCGNENSQDIIETVDGGNGSVNDVVTLFSTVECGAVVAAGAEPAPGEGEGEGE